MVSNSTLATETRTPPTPTTSVPKVVTEPEPTVHPPKVRPGIVTVPPIPREEPDLTNLYRQLLSPVTYLTESAPTVSPSETVTKMPLTRTIEEPESPRLNPTEAQSRWEQFQAFMGTGNQGPIQNALPGGRLR